MISENNKKNLSKLQEIDLKMLKIFLEISQKHNLSYFLLGGSCLGAVRHRGFIPWDDDIDIGMPRYDYEKFLKIAPEELPDGYFLQCSKTEPNYPMNFSKIRNSKTTFIEKTAQYIKMNHGAFIDIFPLDGYKKSKWFNLKNRIYSLCTEKIFFQTQKQNKIKTVTKKILSSYIKDYRKARDKRDCLFKKHEYDKCEFVSNFCGAWGEREIMPKEYFGNGTKSIFEGITVIIPEKYDLYLNKLYGNYMELPPVEKRKAHHFCKVIDLDKPYTEYINKN